MGAMEVKIIIECKDEINHITALSMVKEVIDGGLVSKGRYGEQYCFATVWTDGARVEADKTKNGTHSFRVWKK